MQTRKNILKVLGMAWAILLTGQCQMVGADTLYATDGAGVLEQTDGPNGGNNTSTLYKIDTQSGKVTVIGDIGYRVADIAWDRTRSKLFGTTMRGRNNSNPNFVNSLISINTNTGVGKLIGETRFDVFGDETNLNVQQIDIDSKGNMFGTAGNKFLVKIDSSTGLGTATYNDSIKLGKQGLSIDSTDTIWRRYQTRGKDTLVPTDMVTGITSIDVDPIDIAGAGRHGTFDLKTDLFWTLSDDVITIYDISVGSIKRKLTLIDPPTNTGSENHGIRALAFSNDSETSDIAKGTTLINGDVNNDLGVNRGHIINNGVLASNFTNYGIIDSYNEIGWQSITNQEGGIINIVGNFSPIGTVDNFGTINILPSVGDFPETVADLSSATFNNDGIYRIDTVVTGRGILVNRGVFEITQRGNYKFDSQFNFRQKKEAETIVDGVLRVGGLYGLFGGTLSGSGTVIAPHGIVGFGAGQTFNISPGSPIGTLTLNTDWITLGSKQSLDIEIAGTDSLQYDHLVVTGDIYFYGGMTPVNVLLREGFVPQAGDTFEIINAGVIDGSEDGVSFNFPALPNGLSWEVERTNTSVLLKVL